MSTRAFGKPYAKPVILRRDPVALTTATKSISAKLLIPAPCWVARAVYGAGNPRWLLFRDWLAFQAPAWLRRAYLRHGERLGGLVARSGLLRRALRPLMDRAIVARFGLYAAR